MLQAQQTKSVPPLRVVENEKDIKNQIDKAVSNMGPKENSSETNSKQKQAEMDVHLDKVNHKAEKSATLSKSFVQKSHAVIKGQAEFHNETDGVSRDKIKDRILAQGIMGIEDINAALATLRSAKNDILTRLNSTFDFSKKDLNTLVKERQFPTSQMELELKLHRDVIDGMHRACEANGALRVESEVTNNGKSKKAA